MRGLTTVALVSGPLVLLGYLAGSLTYAFADRDREEARLSAVALEVFATAAATTLAWYTVRELSPGSSFSRVALQSNQVLIVWQSVALWVGLAAIVGNLAPVQRRFRGGSGVVPALTVTLLYAPTLFVAALLGFAGGLGVSGGRPRLALPGALGLTLAAAWLAWVLEWNAGWGVANGPEVTLWAMVTTGALFARWVADGDRTVPRPD